MNEIEHGHEGDELTDEEREAFRALPRQMIPPAGLEGRVVEALRAEGLLRGSAPKRRTARGTAWMKWATAVAAAVALFVSGVALGQWTATRRIADALSGPQPDDAATQAARVQEAGSDYVRAVARLADLAARGDEKAVAPGREAATVALHAAALELARLSPDDATLRLVLAVLEDRLQSSGKGAVSGRKTIWF